MFADRTEWDLTPNALFRRREALRRKGVPVIDLTESNPTRCGFHYPEQLLASLADPAALLYEPSPRGLLSARRAVASIYAVKGIPLDPEQIFLTASTSEAYGFLFRLLTNPGDNVLVPRPSYPLFGYLAGLNDVEPVVYRLRCRTLWEIDFGALSEAVDEKTRAAVVVHPNNPTGSCVSAQQRDSLIRFCKERNLPLISDEVFAEYRYQNRPDQIATLAGDPEVLTFALGGLSKFLGLPQMKLAWIAVTGPARVLSAALERLEVVADTYLSVNTPAQTALSRWLADAPDLQSQILQRVLANRRFLEQQHSDRMRLLPADGGWTAVLQFSAISEEESWVLQLLEKKQLLVYPGYFFDFDQSGIAVVSLLPPEPVFQQGIGRLLEA